MDRVMFSICLVSALVVSTLLLIIVGNITMQALPALSVYFIITPESASPGLGGGIANAIVGTLILSICSTLIATPLALGTAIYLQKYAKETRLVRGFRFLLEVLSGTPSIILGIFGLIFFAMLLRHYTGGFSLIGGSVALAFLILPVIERTAEEAIMTVPESMEQGSYALGATKWDTLRHITLSSSLSGILTGVILGFGRSAEESAVVIFTAGYTQFLPEFGIAPNDSMFLGTKIYPFQDLVATLPITIYNAYQNQHVIPIAETFATAFVLIVLVLCINLTAKIILWKYGHD